MDNDCCFCCTPLHEIKMPVKCCDSSPKGGCQMAFCKDCIEKYLQSVPKIQQSCPGCRSYHIVEHKLLKTTLFFKQKTRIPEDFSSENLYCNFFYY